VRPDVYQLQISLPPPQDVPDVDAVQADDAEVRNT
jgi:hypothetical protein